MEANVDPNLMRRAGKIARRIRHGFDPIGGLHDALPARLAIAQALVAFFTWLRRPA